MLLDPPPPPLFPPAAAVSVVRAKPDQQWCVQSLIMMVATGNHIMDERRTSELSAQET